MRMIDADREMDEERVFVTADTRVCATDGCQNPTVGKSKYCRTHRAEARKHWKEMVTAKAEAKADRDAEFEVIFGEAQAAGRKAGDAVVPEPMVVVEANGHTYPPVMDGVCGFAWVTITPGTCAAARYAAKRYHAHRGYYGGTEIWVSVYGQSMTRKEAYARAFAEVLRKYGITAHAGSRMD